MKDKKEKTKAEKPEKEVKAQVNLQKFFFPSKQITIEAETLEDAQNILKEMTDTQ